jgi:hypothetical protein
MLTIFDKSGTKASLTFIFTPERGVEGFGVTVVCETLFSPQFKIATEKAFKSDFQLELYDALKVDSQEIEEHVRSFLGEKLLQPRRELLWVGRGGELDPDYLLMMQRSIDYWRDKGDMRAVRRFESELIGMQNMVSLILGSSEEIPVVINASDPGEFYVGQDGGKKSVTFVGVLEREEEGGWWYGFFSLPTRYIGLVEHKRVVEDLADIEKTKKLLGSALLEESAEALVAYPMLLDRLTHSIDDVANKLGYDSWAEIEKRAKDQLVLEGDPSAKVRREVLVKEWTRLILEMVRYGNHDEQEVMVDAMADVFAFEAGAEYVGWSEQDIVREIQQRVELARVTKRGIFAVAGYGYNNLTYVHNQEITELLAYRNWVMSRFEANPLAREARATGCGGAGVVYSQGSSSDMFEFRYGNEVFAGFSDFDKKPEPSLKKSTGKYTEYYDYKSGVCAHCGEQKPYVAHPRSSDMQCAGWCSDCET